MKVWEFDAYTYADTLREMRKEKGMTQGDLAKVSGCNIITITNYENGYRLPRIDILLKMGKALGVDEIRFSTERKWYM